jgi:predicted branched-subunit amino acid permease
MKQDCERQAFFISNIAVSAYAAWTSSSHVSLLVGAIGGLGKLAAFVLFASLLMFVVNRSADVWSTAAACLQALPKSIFALIPDRVFVIPEADIMVPEEPRRVPMFQRPPPTFSL